MKIQFDRGQIVSLFAQAGITVNGNNPWDIRVNDDSFFDRLILKGSIGAGESYMDGLWDVPRLDQFFTKAIKAQITEKLKFNLPTLWLFIKSSILNMQTKARSFKVAKEHYNLGNDLYMSFLDPYNQYTCGYFKNTDDLNVAQEQKLNMICQKLRLKSSDRVLDIGCGWGGFSKYAAEHYGCHVTGISISDEQIKYARNFCKNLPVEILKKDYRDLDGEFDKVLVCGMIEHVGNKNYRTLMKKVHNVLSSSGLFLLHTIGGNTSQKSTDPWLSKYIFPNSMIPSVKQLSMASEDLFVMEDWHNFGVYYVNTLLAWYDNFKSNWSTLRERYDQRFFRMWEYYLLGSVGYFESRTGQLWQILFSKNGVKGGYTSIR